MIRKLTLAAGFAAGYVLGAKAGTERYNQIVAKARELAGMPAVQDVTTNLAATASQVGDKARTTVNETVSQVGDKVAGSGSTGSTANGGGGAPAGAASGTRPAPARAAAPVRGAAASGSAPDVATR